DAKRAILEYFKLRKIEPQELGPFEYTDKIPLKHGHEQRGVRVVPGAVVRYGSFLGEGVVVMPGFVNIGAWVGPRTMVDTWAAVGRRRRHAGEGVPVGDVPAGVRPDHRAAQGVDRPPYLAERDAARVRARRLVARESGALTPQDARGRSGTPWSPRSARGAVLRGSGRSRLDGRARRRPRRPRCPTRRSPPPRAPRPAPRSRL